MQNMKKMNKRVYPGQVRLMPGSPFYDRQREMNEFLLMQDDDRMLYAFRKAAGLSTRGAMPLTGWDAEDCKLRGHTTGHYLSALSLAFAATGNERFREKAEYIVRVFAQCQDAFVRSGKAHPGFLSAYDEEQFDLLEVYTEYPEIWAPYYTLDKIMSGLLDYHDMAEAPEDPGNREMSESLQILDALGDWVYQRLSGLSDEHRAKMWSMYIAGEYGCMISTMIRLYRLTGKDEHLAAARLFENEKLCSMMEEGRDELDTMHANQHIPQIMGAAELFIETGERRYLDIAVNFWKIVTEHHCFAIGGTGDREKWFESDAQTRHLTDSTAESCASYNMLRLTSMLFDLHKYTDIAVADLMSYYERTLFNHILMSFSHSADGGTTYFLPLAPWSTKHYETEENSCCHGTGMESRYRYMTQIFSYEGQDLLRINLPVSAALDGDEKVTVTAEFDDENVTVTVRADADMIRRIAVRMPSGTKSDKCTGGVYLIAGRPLAKGESVSIRMTAETLTESVNDYRICKRGPFILAAVRYGEDDLGLWPIYEIDGEQYNIYQT